MPSTRLSLKPGIRSLGRWLEYNKPAAKDAEVKPRAFLAPISAARRRAKRKPAMSTFPRAEFQT